MKFSKTYLKILSVSKKKFQAHGYAAVGIGEILEESGVSRSSLYHFFPGGKEELAQAVLRDIQKDSMQRLESFFFQSDNPVQEFENYFLAKADEIDHGDNRVSVNMLLMEAAESSSRLHELACEIIDSLNAYFYKQVERCGFSEELTCQVASAVLSMSLGAMNYCSITGKSTLLRNVVQQLPLLFEANGYKSKEIC